MQIKGTTALVLGAAILFLIYGATFMTGAVLRMDGWYILGHVSLPSMPPGVLDELR